MAQGALGTAGIRRVWAGDGLQRAAGVQGRGNIVQLSAQLVFKVIIMTHDQLVS